MTNNTNNTEFKNNESPFTELFSLFKQYDNPSVLTLIYTSEELIEIQQHVDTAISTLLQGLQDVGNLIGLSSVNKEIIEAINQLGCFISTITNLT
jgi:hypothetical protein